MWIGYALGNHMGPKSLSRYLKGRPLGDLWFEAIVKFHWEFGSRNQPYGMSDGDFDTYGKKYEVLKNGKSM